MRLEQGLDAFVVVDGLPLVPEESKSKLVKFIIKQLNKAGRVKDDGFFMPLNDKNMTEGYPFSICEGERPSLLIQLCLCRVPDTTTGNRRHQTTSRHRH